MKQETIGSSDIIFYIAFVIYGQFLASYQTITTPLSNDQVVLNLIRSLLVSVLILYFTRLNPIRKYFKGIRSRQVLFISIILIITCIFLFSSVFSSKRVLDNTVVQIQEKIYREQSFTNKITVSLMISSFLYSIIFAFQLSKKFDERIDINLTYIYWFTLFFVQFLMMHTIALIISGLRNMGFGL